MSEKKRRRKSSHHATAFETLSGQLTARSHILNTDPEIVILEVCTIDRSEYILFRKANFALLNHPLIIGQHYNFSKLHSSALKIKSNAVRCFRATDETSWEESNAAAEVYHPPSYNDFTNIEGRVTKIDNNFGILYLKSIPVIISTCSLVAKIPMPKLNQKIHIFNVHRYNDENGQVIYAMCVKSYLRISDESAETPGVCCFVKKSPVLSSLGSDALRGFKFILWLQNCHSKVIRNLDEDFLLFFKVPRSEFLKFYASLVKNIALFLIKKSNIQKKSLVEEFLMADHNSYCGILTEDLVPHSLLNISEIDKETPHLDEVEDESGKRLFWQFNVNLKKDLKRILIGVISVKSASHRLTINDSSGSLYCLMMPEQKDDLTLIDVAALNRKVVLFTDYSVIRERFTWTDRDQLCSQKYNCLAVCSDKVTVVSSLANDQRSSSDKEPPERHTDKIVDKEKYCISLFKSTTFQQFLSQHILVQHKSMVSVPEQGKPARAYLQVLVYGEMTSNTPSPPSSQKNVFPTFISLIGPMLIAHPVIAVNAVYEIRFPIGFDVDFFRKGSPLMCVQSLRGVLPTINCVTLPSCCEIYTVADNPIPTAVMKCRDCYRITECLENVSTRELIDVMGYVTGRYHQDPLYEREKFSVKANGFGTPGCKVMAIILRDTPPESQFGAPITLYLSYWASLQYPLGLLPGSKVIFRFVSRVTSKDGSVYLRSSILSSLEVLKTPNSGQNREIGDPWGPRSALNLIFDEGSNCCHWLTVSMIQLHRVTFTATCSTCSHDYQNGCCTFAGCAVSAAPQIFAQVSFLIEDFKSSSALVFVPNSLISKFFSGSENLLDNISQMTKRYGQMSYYRYLSYEDIAELSIEQRVFRLLCKSYRSRDRFHLLCRKFNKKNDFPHQSDLQVLYAVDINPVSSLMAVS